MCGPFVVSQTGSSACCNKSDFKFSKLSGAALFPYHFGRITTYTLLGVVATMATSVLNSYSFFKYLSAGLLILAALVFITSGLKNMGISFSNNLNAQSGPVSKLISRYSKYFSGNITNRKTYLLGMLLGLIPCGLVYAALLAVSSTASVTSAILGMLAFGLGTMPALMIVGLGSKVLLGKWNRKAKPITQAVMFVNGFVLLLMAEELIRNL